MARRQTQYTLTPRHVHAQATHLLQKQVRLHDHGPKCRAWMLFTVLYDTASRLTSLAAAHEALLATLPKSAELQRRLNRALPHALCRRRQP